MTFVRALLEAAERHAREGGASLPATLLALLLSHCGAGGGSLGRGDEVLAQLGERTDGPRTPLRVGRDEFWLVASGGAEPDADALLALSTALGSWWVREELKRARFAERRRIWEVESLRAIAEALGGTLEQETIAGELVLHMTAMLDARRGEAWLARDGGFAARAALGGAAATGPCPDGSCTVAARVGGAVLAEGEVAALPESGLLEERRIAMPIQGRRGRLGALALAEREVRGGTAPFGRTDMESLALYAAQAAIAFENATLHAESLERELLERELELAATIQRQLLPATFPVPPGFEVAARTESCRQVGGDLYEVVASPAGSMLMLADVAGKGVPAALMASSLDAAVRVLARDLPEVDALADQLHAQLLGAIPDNKFATVFLARLAATGEMSYVSAGHNPAVLVSARGEIELLRACGPPLGLIPGVTYPAERTRLTPGSLLVVYTDGLSEAPSPSSDEDFGVERIAEIVAAHRHAPLEALITALFTAVRDFTGAAPLHDDRSVLALRRPGV